MRTVLVVEDHPDVRDLLIEFFTAEGFRVISCGDGARALALVEAGGFDCAILDLSLPFVDGFTVLKAIRARPGPHMPVIVTSARLDAREAGGDALLMKPYDLPALLDAVRRVLSDRAA